MRVAAIIDRVEPEPEHGDSAIDELVATGVDIHIERMSDGTYWLGIEKDGKRQVVTFSTRREALIIAKTDEQ